MTHPSIESLFAAVSLHIVDDGPVERRGSRHPPGADQDDQETNSLEGGHHLLVEHSSQVDTIHLQQLVLNKEPIPSRLKYFSSG